MAAFVTAAVLVVAAQSTWPARLAGTGLPGHMVQHLVLGMYAPLALVLAAPVTLLLGALPAGAGRRVGAVLRSPAVHVLSHPVTAAVLDVRFLFLLFLTPLHELSQQRPRLHLMVQLHFLAAGFLFTWSIAGRDPAPRRPGMQLRVAVLFAAAAAHSWLAGLLSAHADRLPPGGHAPAAEVELVARWMSYGGDVAEVGLAVALFSWWYRRAGAARGGGAGGGPTRRQRLPAPGYRPVAATAGMLRTWADTRGGARSGSRPAGGS